MRVCVCVRVLSGKVVKQGGWEYDNFCAEKSLKYPWGWGSKTVQWAKALTAKPDDRSSIPKTHVVREIRCPPVVHTHTVVSTHTHTL